MNGYHLITCKHGGQHHFSHKAALRAMKSWCRSYLPHLSVKEEQCLQHHDRNRSDLMLEDFGAGAGPTTVIIDITGVALHASSYEALSLKGYPHTAAARERLKHTKYDPRVPANQQFVPVVLELQGGFGEETNTFFTDRLKPELLHQSHRAPDIPIRILRMDMMCAFRKAHIRYVLRSVSTLGQFRVDMESF